MWTLVKWPYNNDPPYCNWMCWMFGRIILYPGLWPNEGYSYVRTGANSDLAHSGYLPGCITLEDAQARIQQLIEQKRVYP